MEELFKIKKNNIEFVCFKDGDYPEIGLLNLEGALFKETIEQSKEIMEKIKNKNIHDLVIDLSGIKSITKDGWEFLKEYKDKYSKNEKMLVLTRMRPFIHDRFKELKIGELIPYFRTYNQALNHIVKEEDLDDKKNNDNEEDYLSSKNNFESIEGNEKEFPLEESRELNEEIEKQEKEEKFQFEDENEFLGEIPGKEIGPKKEYEENLKSFIIKKIFEWKDKGYKVFELENLIKNDFEDLKEKFGSYLEKIREAEKMKKRLENLNEVKDKDRILDLKQKIYNLNNFDEIKNEYNDFMKGIEAEKKHHQTPILDYNFENFIKGKCNKDSYDMSKHIVDKLEKFRRPVYLFGPNGSGKTHLLNAIGNKIRSGWDKKVFYIGGNNFKIKVKKFIKEDKIEQLRNEIMSNDVVLLDDFNNLSGLESAIFEFRMIYEAIRESNMKLFITSVKKPDFINKLSSDLKSRLNDSIFLKLTNIDRDTFHNIIKIHFEGNGIAFDEEILEFLYAKAEGDIRKAFGFVNTLKIFYEAKHEKINLQKTKNILGFEDEIEETEQFLQKEEVDKYEFAQTSEESEKAKEYDDEVYKDNIKQVQKSEEEPEKIDKTDKVEMEKKGFEDKKSIENEMEIVEEETESDISEEEKNEKYTRFEEKNIKEKEKDEIEKKEALKQDEEKTEIKQEDSDKEKEKDETREKKNKDEAIFEDEDYDFDDDLFNVDADDLDWENDDEFEDDDKDIFD